MNKPVKEGGFGMLDVNVLDDSLKLRALGRLLDTAHPFLSKIRNGIDLGEFYFPHSQSNLDLIAVRGIELLKEVRQRLWVNSNRHESDRLFIETMKGLKVSKIVNRLGKQSLPYFNLIVRNKRHVKDLNEIDFARIDRFIEPRCLIQVLRRIIRVNWLPNIPNDKVLLTYKSGKWENLKTLTSKRCREILHEPDPITIFRIGIIMTPIETINTFTKLSKITSTRHKNIILRALHGDVYTNETTCTYSIGTINEIFRLTSRLATQTSAPDNIQRALGTYLNTNECILTIHAELISIINRRKLPVNNPNANAMTILRRLLLKENKLGIKRQILTLLNEQ